MRRFLANKTARVALALCFLTGAALQAIPLNLFPSTAVAEVSAQSGPAPAVEGWVKDSTGSQPVAGAQVLLNDTLRASTDAQGYFSFNSEELGRFGVSSEHGLPVSVQVNAPGHASWSISNARYFSSAALRLHATLPAAGEGPSVFTAAAPSGKSLEKQIADGLTFARSGSSIQDHLALDDASAQASAPAASSALVPPATIRVYRTATGVVEVVPFREYVKHVLPSEWIPTWKMASLQAGAMAVKSYGWYWVSQGGKQTALGADVKDNTEDQVYDPNISYSTTDEAVDSTYDYAMTRAGALFQAQYCAGSYDEDPSGECPWGGPYMTQWGSAWHADQGRNWGWLLQFYYRDAVITPAPPGGGYDGPPVAPSTPAPRRPAPTAPAAAPANYNVGQGADSPQVFQEAYDRNGGEAALGKPTGPVRWWLTYISEHNVVAQPFSGLDGKGNTWLVFDVLKVPNMGVSRAYLLQGALATVYAQHEPPGPEWLGAPTSDPFTVDSGSGAVTRQGFVRGSLRLSGGSVEAAPWPQSFPNWKAEYFAGHHVPSAQVGPQRSLPGYPASVQDVQTPSFSWSADQQMPYTLGAGKADWSVQLTRQEQTEGGTYEFTLSADSGVRLWIDNMLAINGWHWTSLQQERYSADLSPGAHQVRVQYYNLDASAQLGFEMKKQGDSAPPPANVSAPVPQPQQPPQAQSAAQLRVRVQWIGRGAAPGDSWVQPLTLHLSNPATAAVVASYNGATDRNGVAQYSGLPAGIYNVHVKGAHSLQSARANIALSTGATLDLDMKMQVEGDVNGDNCVTVDDFSYLQARLGTHRNAGGFDPAADLNNDGEVSVTDVSLLRSGFDLCGDVSADAQFGIQSASAAPPLSQLLAPWLRPEALSRDLGLSIWTSADQVRMGEYVDVAVVAQTGAQPVDGASFVMQFDPAVFSPVDAAGNPATAMEPGLALPSVMGNWLDANGGAAGFSAGMLQGETPSGQVVLAKVRFRVLSAPANGTSALGFRTSAPNLMQLTNGGLNLLGTVNGATISVSR
ncbi:MAG TPA: SpoIID/LytB domain-containing protein [Chloroflexia bacterium]|nr:SpoIID/LytB domain-containing protein [Chloroflexia bacterium]